MQFIRRNCIYNKWTIFTAVRLSLKLTEWWCYCSITVGRHSNSCCHIHWARRVEPKSAHCRNRNSIWIRNSTSVLSAGSAWCWPKSRRFEDSDLSGIDPDRCSSANWIESVPNKKNLNLITPYKVREKVRVAPRVGCPAGFRFLGKFGPAV